MQGWLSRGVFYSSAGMALMLIVGPGCAQNECGDGRVADLEACDDGGESASCDVDCSPVECGDGVANAAAGEECDASGLSATCDADCTLPTCGDSVANGIAGEECDDGNSADGDGCSASCLLEVCGDGVVNNNGMEECDNGIANSDSFANACRTDCTNPICGDGVTDTGEECDPPDGGVTCDASCVCTAFPCGPAGYRATEIRVLTPATLGIVNGLLATGIAQGDINVLFEALSLGGGPTTVSIGEGMATGPGTYAVVGMTSVVDADVDPMGPSLVTTGPGALTITVGLDTDGDGIIDQLLPVPIYSLAAEPLMSIDFAPDLLSYTDTTSRMIGGFRVDDACMVNIDLGTGTPLNVLDILDGSTGVTTPPTTTPPCAAGTGADNVQPDVDTDGDMVPDAYRVEAETAGVNVTIVGF